MNMPVAMSTRIESRTLECGETLLVKLVKPADNRILDEPFLRTTPQLHNIENPGYTKEPPL
jgi:hypothetical protein